MINEIRIYISEVLLHLILYVVPKTPDGIKLVKAIKKYSEKEILSK